MSSSSSSSSLPPPPKLSGLVNNASSASPLSSSGVQSASSRLRTAYNSSTPSSLSSSRYQTPSKKTSAVPASKSTPPSTAMTSSSSTMNPSYESFAPRSSTQRNRLARIAALTAGPCQDIKENHHHHNNHHSVENNNNVDDNNEVKIISLASAMCPPKPTALLCTPTTNITNSSSSSQIIIQSTLAQTNKSIRNLSALIKHTTTLKLALIASVNIANDVSHRHEQLLKHSGELSAAAERLQVEESLLSKRADEIGKPLKHYDAVDSIGNLVGVHFKEGGRVIVNGIPKLHVDDDERFVSVLRDIDDALIFFGENGGVARYGLRYSSSSTTNSNTAQYRSRSSRQYYMPYDVHNSGSVEYYRRACALQDAALELIREGVADRISTTTSQVCEALGIPKSTISAEKLEASLAYTRFHGISKRSNALIGIVRKRLEALKRSSSSSSGGNEEGVASPPYEELLTLCRNTYCGSRETLLASSVRAHMDSLKERHGLVGMTRLASVFLIRLCTVETALYLDFFGDEEKRHYRRKGSKGGGAAAVNDGADDKTNDNNENENEKDDAATSSGKDYKRTSSTSSHPSAATLASHVLSEDPTYRDAEFQSMLGSLCSALHRTIRRGLVSVLDLDVLCQVVSVLREERSAANSSPTTLAAARAVSGVIQDAQERLIYCANAAMHKEVTRFKPTASDLNYPGKLLGEKPKPAIIINDEDDAEKKLTSGVASSGAEGAESSLVEDAVTAQLKVYESWFPPMRSVLRVLSKIFRVVEPRVFEDIALQSVQACSKCLKDGSIIIRNKSGQIHADLFLVKHLLILREQLSPFDIQLRSVERQLDFSEAGKAVSRFLANRNRRLFSMSTENALVTLLREGVSVQEASVDSKRDLEDCLRSACNDFIEHTSTSLLGPIAGLLDQCKNAVGSGDGSSEALAKASFMNGVVVKGIFGKAVSSLDGALENVMKQMNLYLENTATQSILLKPVVRKLTRALEESKRFIGDVPDGENGWDVELRADVMKLCESFEDKVKIATAKQGTRNL